MSEYAERDAIGLGSHYSKHVEAMTAENLHEKADIAAELAWRDCQIKELENEIEQLKAEVAGWKEANIHRLCNQRISQLNERIEKQRRKIERQEKEIAKAREASDE